MFIKIKNFFKSIFCHHKYVETVKQETEDINKENTIEPAVNSCDRCLISEQDIEKIDEVQESNTFKPLTIKQYSELHNVPKVTVSRWVKSGKISVNEENLIVDTRIPVKDEKARKYVFQ